MPKLNKKVCRHSTLGAIKQEQYTKFHTLSTVQEAQYTIYHTLSKYNKHNTLSTVH